MADFNKVKVCGNCREPLGKWRSKYCPRCYPHVKRMNDHARFKTQKWPLSSKACVDCKKLFPVSMMSTKHKTSGNGKRYTFTMNYCKECNKRRKANSQRVRKTAAEGLPATLTADEWQETLDGAGGKCVYCGEPWEHQDHFVPLSKGGGYTALNIVPSCAKCNQEKGDKDPFEFIREKLHTPFSFAGWMVV